ncbi:RHS repeat-associated core domain-containing protein [Rhodanobacter denitrificans]|uniref:RHS repeat-associated core domain protein n=1 Tax=Rhodanobacter denitrificans TaxID=666685 RepID=M4NFV9_9GAMM|nr:RHS repeat-associated core domain-containing protein [Rhodanobacter denitrificans]AGG89779.1 RHS repeat-associated core domain protein [Rhodanobacter denitrificans]UJM85177.1 RHS repeat-associated core domain-containing protein [Rhodanobacter denitrificans]
MNPLKILLSIAALWLSLGAAAHAGTVTYVYSDPQGTPLAEADANGTITATFDYQPYGVQALGTAPNGPGYTGHVNDPDTGLVYMQARYYDPSRGGFLSVDPVAPTPGNLFNFNRYDYTSNNPVNHTDPDGRCSDADGSCGRMVAAQGAYAATHPNEPLSPIAKVGLGVMLTASGAGAVVEAVGMVKTAVMIDKVLSDSPKTELVQRGMSKAELKATQDSGLVRGGRSGTHYASDAVNSSAGRAQQRLALPTKPEVRVTLEVPAGRFSAPTRVEPNFNMPGGGMERTATGDVPATVVRTDTMQQ